MEIKEPERVVVAKPVASRPTCSNFGSFSGLLVDAINASPPNECSDTAVRAIRPKTVRFKPMLNLTPVALASTQAESSGAATCNSSDRVSESDSKPRVVYKPRAKLVSKATVSLLANMGNFSTSQQQTLAPLQTCLHHPNQEKNNFQSQRTSSIRQSIPCHAEPDQPTDSSRLTGQNQEEDTKILAPVAANADRPSYDGYNWRKYGQKQVKGSEYPRSYYKCTHPNCPVKKKVERSFDGQIAEIVYKGEHNHSKPQPPKHNSPGTQGTGVESDGTAEETVWSDHLSKRNEGLEGRIENQNGTGCPTFSTYQSKAPPAQDPAGTGPTIDGSLTPDNSCGLSGECDEANRGLEEDDDEPRSKRSHAEACVDSRNHDNYIVVLSRKRENQSSEVGISEEGAQGPRIVVQSSTDSEILGDGFRWRKYGQKVVKGNPYPRSYYRCTGLKCNVRKHVERASDDPRAFITTYEGKHNHEMPQRSTTPAASEPDLNDQ